MFGKGHSQLYLTTHENRKKINKFKESAWKCVYFLSAELLALCVTYNEPWFTNTKYFWEGPGEQIWPEQKIKSVPRLAIFESFIHVKTREFTSI